MLKRITMSLVVLALAVCQAQQVVWNAENGFAGWSGAKNCTVSPTEAGVMISVTARDPRWEIRGLSLNPNECNTFSYTYRATGKIELVGQLFYAHENENFTDNAKWMLPVMKADGLWHTVTLTGTDLLEAWSWFGDKPITSLRFDPTDSAAGEIEISEIKFFFQESAVMKVRPMPALAKVAPRLDAPAWPAAKADFHPLPESKRVTDYAYFQGKLISSPQDKRGLGAHTSFYVRKEIRLKDEPERAMLQFTADDSVVGYLNGAELARFANWKELCVVKLDGKLHKGLNALGFRYTNLDNVGGMLAELFVRYPGGECEYFTTDASWLTAAVAEGDWCKPGYDDSGWEKTIEHAPPPSSPWTVALPYHDFANNSLQTLKNAMATPAAVRAGKSTRITMTFAGTKPTRPFLATLRLVADGDVVWDDEREFTADDWSDMGIDKWQLSFDYATPAYISTMKGRLEIFSTFFAQTPSVELSVRQLKSIPGFEEKPVFKVVDVNGRPVFSLNDRPVYPLWGGVQRERRPDNQPIHNSGVLDIATLYVVYPRTWQAPGVIKFYEFDRQAEAYRRNNKDAYFIVDIQCYPPKGWDKLHPDEMCIDGLGNVNKDGGRLNHSFASENYLTDTLGYLDEVLNYLEHCPYANRIIGYRITGGHTLEWLGWDPNPATTVDFSPAVQRAFKAYAQEKYPQLTDWTIPTLAEREALDGDEILWDQKKHLKSVAFADFYSDSVVKPMMALARRAKEIVGPDKVIGFYYGYTMTLGASGRSQMRAHYALKETLKDADCIDFIISPHPYGLRNIGDIMGDMKPFATLNNHGVIPVIEDDSRTFRCPSGLGYFQMINEATTVNVLRRNMADTLCRNYQYYFYNLSAGSEFDFPQAEKDLATLRTVGQFCVDKAVPRAAEVALVASEETIKAMPMLKKSTSNSELIQSYDMDGTVITRAETRPVFTGDVLEKNYVRFARSGAAMDYVLAEDLADNPGDYKLYVFLNCIKYDEAFLKAVEKLKERDCTLLWIYAPGYSYGLDNGVEHMKRLTGFDFQISDGPLMPAVTLEDGKVMGTRTTRILPMFHVVDGEAETMGTYEDGTVGLARKTTGKATSIYCGVWQFDVPFLTQLLKDAGVHVFSETSDPVDANAALFTLHARFPGKKHIRLPKKTDVIDIFNRQLVGKGIDEFEYDSPMHETRFFYYGDDARELLEQLK